MPQTLSNPIVIGAPAIPFRLPEPLTGKEVALEDFAGAKAVLVAFISNVCPFVKLIDESFNQFAKDYAARGLKIVAINSNAEEIKEGEGAAAIAETARSLGYAFPYLRDESQKVAEAYDARCTPDFFLYDGEGKLYYHGQFDDARPKNGIEPNGASLRAAVDALLAGKPAPAAQTQSIGCNIKWRDGDDHGVRQAPQAVAA
ncbi:MAG: thioredoxin family protein [Moraxellaceae bacterium]|nr:thioredoxin family protein [Moraxellaceae bacterium]